MAAIDTKNPAFSKSLSLTYFVAYAIVVGGVPLGIMKSSETPIPASLAIFWVLE